MRTFEENLAAHDVAQDRVVDWLRTRGWAVHVPPFEAEDQKRPDAYVPYETTRLWLDFKLHHTIEEKEIHDHFVRLENGEPVVYLLDCEQTSFSPCMVPCGRNLLDDRFTERVRLTRSGDWGRKVMHPFLCRSASMVFA